MRLPVVKVRSDNEDGYKLINEKDFDKNKHELFDAPKKRKPKARRKKDDK